MHYPALVSLDTSDIPMLNEPFLKFGEWIMYAIVETGGKQYRVETGTTIQVERLQGDVGTQIELNKVHVVQSNNGILVGQPLINGAKITAEIVRQGRTRSITVFKKKRRKNYRRTRGHRQGFSQLLIKNIATA
ncbi:MAG: LSU ribosomal protein L21p [Nitrospira sp.]|jgi:large subunit ribosomal protein L21|nr:LSU ribosomal protein L21p [Nitrospira sp.]